MTTYSIGEISELMSLSVPTLRYYDKEGLLPFIGRDSSGRRIFSHRDIVLLSTIECLKATGMPLKDIRQYVDWCVEGFETIPKRYEMVLHQRQVIEEQKEKLQAMLNAIDYKCAFYKNALETGNADLCDTDREEWARKVLEEDF